MNQQQILLSKHLHINNRHNHEHAHLQEINAKHPDGIDPFVPDVFCQSNCEQKRHARCIRGQKNYLFKQYYTSLITINYKFMLNYFKRIFVDNPAPEKPCKHVEN